MNKLKFTLFVAVMGFLGFLFLIGVMRNDASYKKSVAFCEDKGFTSYSECQKWWIESGEYKK